MSLFLLYSNTTSETGPKISELLKSDMGTAPPNKPYDFIVNYGSTIDVDPSLAKIAIINDPSHVKQNAQNKGQALRTMYNEGVSVPRTYPVLQALARSDELLPLLGRKGSHVSGSGFYMCVTEEDMKEAIDNGCTHFADFLSIKQEYRVHMMGGFPFLIQEKANNGRGHKYIRTNSNGWQFLTKDLHRSYLPNSVMHNAVMALDVLGMDFGAVDIGIDSRDDAYIFEVNSGAGLTGGDHAKRFVNALSFFITEKYGVRL